MAAILVLSGCKKPNPNPELLDPIYSELNKHVDRVDKAIQEEEAALLTTIETLNGLEPRDITRKHTTKERFHREKNLSRLKQEKKFYLVRRSQRKEYVGDAYMKAFNAGQPWPDPSEIQQYRKVFALRTASRNWDERVPKLTRHNKGSSTKNMAEKK